VIIYFISYYDNSNNSHKRRKWAEYRSDDKEHVPVIQVPEKKFIRDVKELSKRYDLIIIDGRPTESDHTDRITMVSDIVIVPVKFGLYELRALENYFDIYDGVKEAKESLGGKLSGYVVLNDIGVGQTTKKEMIEAVNDAIGESEIALLDSILYHRKIYADSPADGIGVIESKDKKARLEVEDFVNEVEKIIQKYT